MILLRLPLGTIVPVHSINVRKVESCSAHVWSVRTDPNSPSPQEGLGLGRQTTRAWRWSTGTRSRRYEACTVAAACSAAAWASEQLLGQLVQPGAQLVHQLFQLDDPLDAGQVHALALAQPLHLAQQRDVPGRVAAPAAGRPAGADQPQPVVAAQRLRVQAGQLGGHRDDEHRAVRGGPRRQRRPAGRHGDHVLIGPPAAARPAVRRPWSPRRRTAAPWSPRRPAGTAPRPRP